MGTFSFLTPEAALFVLAALVPLGALLGRERRAGAIRRALSLASPRRRALAPAVLALVLLPALVAVAAAQPVIVRSRELKQRADVQAFFVFDTSLSMQARDGRRGLSRLARAKRDALRIERSIGDIPVGIATMTDRTLPNLLPTTDTELFERALAQSVRIDSPPPSQRYPGRATSFQALVGLGDSHFYAPGVTHRILVVFTDGEAGPEPGGFRATIGQSHPIPALLVHVWRPDDRIYVRGGKVDPRYRPDPTSGRALQSFAGLLHGRVFGERDAGAVAEAIRAAAGSETSQMTITAASRVALAPWFLLGGVVPLAFLLWRRNL